MQVSSARTRRASAACWSPPRRRARHQRPAGRLRAAAQGISGLLVVSAPPRKASAGRWSSPRYRAGHQRAADGLHDGAEGGSGVVLGDFRGVEGENGRFVLYVARGRIRHINFKEILQEEFYKMAEIKPIPITQLQLDLINPRYHDPNNLVLGERQILQAILNEQGNKLIKLMADIVEAGVDPSSLPIIIPDPVSPKLYIVAEGNRRLAALKILSSPDIIKELLYRTLKSKRKGGK